MNDEAKPDETERNEQIEEPQQAEQDEQTQQSKKPKMCKLAVLSFICLIAASVIFAMYLFSSEAALPLRLEKLIFPVDVAVLVIAFVAAVVALAKIKSSTGALAGRRLALLGIIVPIVVAVAFVRSKAPPEEPQVSPVTECMEGIRQLGIGLLTYAQANEGKLPAAQKWCDVLVEQMNADEALFTCPVAEGGRCSYSLNKYAVEAGADLPENMVLLFESGPGWNQAGGSELFVASHETRRGSAGSVVLSNGEARFVFEENIDELNWKPGQDSENKESESEEPEEE